jgi:hypothetical protein
MTYFLLCPRRCVCFVVLRPISTARMQPARSASRTTTAQRTAHPYACMYVYTYYVLIKLPMPYITYTYVCMYVCKYVYTYVYTYVCMYICIHVYMYTQSLKHIHTPIHTPSNVHDTYRYVHICTCIHTHTHTHTHTDTHIKPKSNVYDDTWGVGPNKSSPLHTHTHTHTHKHTHIDTWALGT